MSFLRKRHLKKNTCHQANEVARRQKTLFVEGKVDDAMKELDEALKNMQPDQISEDSGKTFKPVKREKTGTHPRPLPGGEEKTRQGLEGDLAPRQSHEKLQVEKLQVTQTRTHPRPLPAGENETATPSPPDSENQKGTPGLGPRIPNKKGVSEAGGGLGGKDSSLQNRDEIIWKKDGAKMCLIPAGEFQMGSNDGLDNEKPIHTVYLDAFYMDKYEVTVGQYKKFDKKFAAWYRDLPDWLSEHLPNDNHPVILVSWDKAQAYCKWAGKRLPTEAEWEKAARGGLVGKKYPWGDEAPDAGGKYRTNSTIDDGYKYSAPVGSFPPNGYGLHDMAGNVYEWCLDAYESDYYNRSQKRNPVNDNFTSVKERVIRGGSWNLNGYYMRVATRRGGKPVPRGGISMSLGFRCSVSQDVTP